MTTGYFHGEIICMFHPISTDTIMVGDDVLPQGRAVVLGHQRRPVGAPPGVGQKSGFPHVLGHLAILPTGSTVNHVGGAISQAGSFGSKFLTVTWEAVRPATPLSHVVLEDGADQVLDLSPPGPLAPTA